ncbi:MAG: serine/threonine protein kinase, partial [Deltaproteobacteria bacterium]|nr:serine/threonine protein kinase [Deltaproteobacteria bacterium]
MTDAPPTDPKSTEQILAPGVYVDHFRIMRLVGKGGMGEVYLARDMKLGRKVALKLLRGLDASKDASAQFFLREAKTTARFAHPHIITIYAVGEGGTESFPYVALEYLEGATLRERMTQNPPTLGESIRIALDIADALQEAERHQILHRDLKPENVMLPEDGRLRVLDFGLAKPFTPAL